MKKLALFLSVILVLAVFASCGDNGSDIGVSADIEDSDTQESKIDTGTDDSEPQEEDSKTDSPEESVDDYEDDSDDEESKDPEGPLTTEYPVINGTFIQYFPFLSYSDAELTKHFDYLKEVGIEYLVLYVSANQNADGTFSTVYYPSEIAKKNKGSNYDDSNKDITKKMLDQCKSHGFKAFISLNYPSDSWFSKGVSDKKWSDNLAKVSVDIAEEMHDLYKKDYGDTFYGWYFVPEFDNNFNNYKDLHFDNAVSMLNIFLDGMTKVDSGMPFLISPYFGDKTPYSNAVDTASGWDRVFSKLNFRKGDIFCPQDCVGSGLASMKTFESYYAEFKKVVDKYPNLSFWGNPESFKQANWTSAPMTRFEAQLKAAQPYVEGFISFAYSHYYAPDIKKTSTFHDAYKKYYETGKVDYYSTNPKATPIKITGSQDASGVSITASFNNSKYGITYVEVFRESTRIGTVHTPESDYSAKTLEYFYKDNDLDKSGKIKYYVKAYDFLGDLVGEQSVTVEVKKVNKVSIDKPYTSDYDGNPGYPDRGGKMLTDGKYAPEATYSASDICGFADVSQVTFTIDLLSAQDIERVVARGVTEASGGLKMCSTIVVEFSTDGSTFTGTQTVSTAGHPDVAGFTVVDIPVNNIKARYVRVRYQDLQGWLFIDEIEVMAK